MTKVCHVTSVHPKEDVRIFQKECVSLAKASYAVTLVQQGDGAYEKDGVQVIGFGARPASRVKRMLFTARHAYQKALAVDADIYHLHDPELLPYGLKLKRRGKKVIFDSHEDVPADILEKYWIPAFLRKAMSSIYARYESYCFSKLDGVLSVTPHICDRIAKTAKRMEMVSNYPILEANLPQPTFERRAVVFPGLVNDIWNLDVLIEAIHPLDEVTLELRSHNIVAPYLEKLQQQPGWEKVNFPGKVTHQEVLKLISQCMCGAALARYTFNTGGKTGTLGNTKIFEYMMVGVPVVCTDFVLWKEIVERYQCGICVPPEDVDAVRSAIRYLLDNPAEARRMGENGRRAIKEEFNWAVEEKKLLAFYEEILNEKP